LVMSHNHPAESANVARLIEQVTEHGHVFSGRHRIIDTHGQTHLVLVIGEQMCGDDGSIIGSQGFYVDLSDYEDNGTVDAAIADFTAHRACIEQAKGILMMTYGISAERAFDILVWRSQETNTKLRRLALQIIRDFTAELRVPSNVRAQADQLLLTAHRRIAAPAPPVDSHGFSAVPCSSSIRVVTPVVTMVRVASTDACVQKMCISAGSEACSVTTRPGVGAMVLGMGRTLVGVRA
jgi:hypothetical protein